MDNMHMSRIVPFIKRGTVIPIISNSFRIEQIFRQDDELVEHLSEVPEFYDEVRTIEQQLTKEWAEDINYPMSDNHNLARVAQYHQVASGDPELAKIEYLKFLNGRLLQMSERREGYESKVKQLGEQSDSLLFSDAVQQLDYPSFSDGTKDPLELLAKLPLPIYVTTSYYNFLERALEDAKRTPRTQLCFLSAGISSVKQKQPELLPDPDYEPTVQNPAVYHLFGLENYSNTLILSEDDYMNFLISAVEEITSRDLYPSALQQALPESRLILLGYNLRDWDFRTLFRFILRTRKTAGIKPSIAIQFRPSLEKMERWEKTENYLEAYFHPHDFSVIWANAEKFIYELWDKWSQYK